MREEKREGEKEKEMDVFGCITVSLIKYEKCFVFDHPQIFLLMFPCFHLSFFHFFIFRFHFFLLFCIPVFFSRTYCVLENRGFCLFLVFYAGLFCHFITFPDHLVQKSNLKFLLKVLKD